MKLNVQFIKHPGSKERMVVLPESQFRILKRTAMAGVSELDEPAPHSPLPKRVLDRIAAGENPVRAVRILRGLSGRQLAAQAGITPSMLSQIERSGKTASTKTLKAIAHILEVPLGAISPHLSAGIGGVPADTGRTVAWILT
ncbi:MULTISPECIES: helix-turn-helix transcriptional regulator [unclassified Mesorhizobium]|uniref:helix-turn-helix domain-containing protein n=1 Tax=unclassified Mesorhizobium TaxID=325217 RepID=UPI00112C6E37|nr:MULTISPECIES: helix-turn-helix transcriptional regulator [unclassified Mesorhizobium]TPK95139.1 helix-turn-helix transcriptional regulator [Mesorhizobium sp. B2-4-16]TPL62869.1 helix-turn-helix transcriptional regulator [Mesorhizobium sp. B2-4-3]